MKTGQTKPLLRRAVGNPLVVLAAVATLNGLIYWLLFLRSWPLTTFYGRPLLNLPRLSADDPLARWRLLGAFAALGLLYWVGWRAARRVRGAAGWTLVLASAAVFGVILLFLHPFSAADVFDNIMHGRILSVYGANPFEQVAADFEGDPFFPYVAWRRYPSAYGPGWELIAAATSRLAGDGIMANVLAFKLVGGLFLMSSVGIVAALLRRRAPQRALAGTLLIAWNPVILYETLGQGHNDIAMVFWILLATWWLSRGRRSLAILALVAGALFKFIPLLLIPAAGLIALRSLPRIAARLRFFAITVISAIVLVMLAYAPFWNGPETVGVERRRILFTSSVPAATVALLEASMDEAEAESAVSLAAGVATALFALYCGARASRAPSWQSFARAAFYVLIFYLLVTCAWFQQWYALWPLALVPLLPVGHLTWWGSAYGFAAQLKPLIFEPIWLWTHYGPDRTWLEPRLGPAVQAVPWLLAGVAIWAARRERRCRIYPPRIRD